MQPVEERKLLISSPGTPKDFSDQGFWRKFFDAKTDSISSFVIYAKNEWQRDWNRTDTVPDFVKLLLGAGDFINLGD